VSVTDALEPHSGADARALASTELALATAPGPEPIARLEDAMLRITGIADRTDDEVDRLSVLRMNETLRLLAGPPRGPRSGTVLGLALWDGTLVYDEPLVTGPLRQMVAYSGAQHDAETLRRYRYAVSEMLHQSSHLLCAPGSSYGASREAFADPAVRLLEMGVTEAWSARHLDEYVDALGLEPVAPGIKTVGLPVSYPAYVPAVDALTEEIGRRSALPADEVLRRLNTVTPAAKPETAAVILLEASGLASVVPPAARGAVTAEVTTALLGPLLVMATEDTTGAPESTIMAASALAGRLAVEAAEAEIEAVRRRSIQPM
jgi:hypothetical protein